METAECPQEPRLNSQLQCKSWAQRNLTWLAKTPGMMQALPELDTVWKGWPATEISARETTKKPAEQACQNQRVIPPSYNFSPVTSTDKELTSCQLAKEIEGTHFCRG